MNPEKWFFLNVKPFDEGLRILQRSSRLYFSRSCKIFEIDFLFNVGLPPEVSKFKSKNKLKSPANITCFHTSSETLLSNWSNSQKVLICSVSVLEL